MPKLNVLLFVVPAVVYYIYVVVVVAFGEKLKLLFDSEEVLLLVKLNGLALSLLPSLLKALVKCCAGEELVSAVVVVGVLLNVKAFVLLQLLPKALLFAVG